jgi:chromosome segregation and condensation protein ScpB
MTQRTSRKHQHKIEYRHLTKRQRSVLDALNEYEGPVTDIDIADIYSCRIPTKSIRRLLQIGFITATRLKSGEKAGELNLKLTPRGATAWATG